MTDTVDVETLVGGGKVVSGGNSSDVVDEIGDVEDGGNEP